MVVSSKLLATAFDSEDEPADPNIIYEEPDDEASSSDKDVSDARQEPLFSIVIFFAGSVRRDKKKRDAFYQSKADTAPPCSHGPLPEE